MRRVLPCLLAALSLVACWRGGGDVTDEGKSRPQVSVEFPPTAEAGSTQQAVVEITNPGPGDMNGLRITFARLGDPRLPRPIVDVGRGKENPAIAGIDPEPKSVSTDGVVYVFDGLDEGESTTITFDLVMPTEPGLAANSLSVSDQDELDRARGARLETDVQS